MTRHTDMTPETIIRTLGMQPHPEGGWYAETWRGQQTPRAAGSAIYFLLEAHQNSRWHRVDAVEIWHWYAGGPLELHIHAGQSTQASEEPVNTGSSDTQVLLLGADLTLGQRPQLIVPTHAWQKAQPLDGWVLVGCTVSPGFEFAGFELAEAGWEPGPSMP
jgi:predicted cupin superfamily sugar epimerase